MSVGSMMTELVVGIAGPSGAGKSTLAASVAAALGDRAIVLAYDAYYRDLSAAPPSARSAVNFDAPEALEAELLVSHLRSLRLGHPIEVPRYDYVDHVRLAEVSVVVPRRVVVVEGLFVLADPRIRAEIDLRAYVDASNEVRLRRRIARDTAQRGRTIAQVQRDWRHKVRPAEANLIVPSLRWANLVLSGEVALASAVEDLTGAILGRLARSGTEEQTALEYGWLW